MEGTFDQIDRRLIRGVVLEALPYQHGGNGIVLELGGSTSPECRLRVSSTDLGTGKAIFARVSDEVDRGVPWWGKVHRVLRGFLVALILALGFFAVELLLHRSVAEVWFGTQPYYAIAGVAIGMVSFLLSIPTGPLSGFFPVFELHEGTSSVTRRLAAALLLLLSIPIGIFVNNVS
jgi:hypothetical protein